MGYSISGLVTSFKYKGNLPHKYLISDFVFIPLDSKSNGFKGFSEKPSEELTPKIKRLAKEMSYEGKVAFIEADFFGGSGEQCAMVWENGKLIWGPKISTHDSKNDDVGAINEALVCLGVYPHGEKDVFSTLNLGWNRSNAEWLEEINNLSKN
ncbi:hypothetical protein [Pleionea sediminis]|uniref:hypothetical protein n=1 Tax=Pleionea sediminis TaxID=2569479 RepID=UPI001185519F|nr:hypothetical protein [Pleionea sediminis]